MTKNPLPNICFSLHFHRSAILLDPHDEPTLSTLQRQANLFHQLRLIACRVNVRDATTSLCMRQNWTY